MAETKVQPLTRKGREKQILAPRLDDERFKFMSYGVDAMFIEKQLRKRQEEMDQQKINFEYMHKQEFGDFVQRQLERDKEIEAKNQLK